ncbi:ribosomal-processing cysteine protease Prp [Ornithinibacillus sp. 4-3]|uniref:Ribosomal processing cysteine protease Prp n=1 Tax=Ornithinibacillus sp. 4-3 TaxID=3231488 RepID=A0AB39HLM7_9BACI
MITVKLFKNNNDITAFEISGHANSGPYGYDLVCAGVSAVSFGAVNAIIELCQIEPIIEQGREGGYLHVTLPIQLEKEEHVNTQLILRTMIISLETIEREYKQFIQIKEN